MKKEYRTDVSVLDSLADKWPSSVVARAELHKLTGGILNGRTMANCECREDSDSIPRFRTGKKVFYQVVDVIDFLKRKIEK
jgi:hypothetical protein